MPDGSTNFRLTNVGWLHTRGVEVETTAWLTSNFNVGGSVAYLDAHFTDYPAAQCYPGQTAAQGCTGTPPRQSLTGVRLGQTPKWKLVANADYSPALTDRLRGVVQANVQYQTSLNFQIDDPQAFQPAYAIVNLGLGIRAEDRRWEVVGFVNNLLDKQYFANFSNASGTYGGQLATTAYLPRDFRRYAGVRLGFNY